MQPSDRPKGRRLVVQVSGGALARKKAASPRQSRSNHGYGKIGTTQFLEQDLASPAPFLFPSCFISIMRKSASRSSSRPTQTRSRGDHSRSRKFDPMFAFFRIGSKS